MKTTQIWQADVQAPQFPTLDADLSVDVLIVGGGITGVTAALMLKRAGRSVAVIERGRIGGGETGHTTAHVTYATDKRFTALVRTFGKSHAQAAWDAGRLGMEQIATFVASERIDCECRRVPGSPQPICALRLVQFQALRQLCGPVQPSPEVHPTWRGIPPRATRRPVCESPTPYTEIVASGEIARRKSFALADARASSCDGDGIVSGGGAFSL